MAHIDENKNVTLRSNPEKKDFVIEADEGYRPTLEVLANDLIISRSGEHPFEKITKVWRINSKTAEVLFDGNIHMTFPFGLPNGIIIGSQWTADGYKIIAFNPKTGTFESSLISCIHPILQCELFEGKLITLISSRVEVWDFNTLELEHHLSTNAHDFIRMGSNILVNTRGKTIEIWNPITGGIEANREFGHISGEIYNITPEICIVNHKNNAMEIWYRHTGKKTRLGSCSYFPTLFILNATQVVSCDQNGIVKIYNLDTNKINSGFHDLPPGSYVKLLCDGRIGIRSDNKFLLWNIKADRCGVVCEETEPIADFGSFQDGRIYFLLKGNDSLPNKLKIITVK